MDEPPPELPEDWLAHAWLTLPGRWSSVLDRRLAGDTLDAIARPFGLSRERARQIQVKAEAALVEAQQRHAPDFGLQLADVLQNRVAVPDKEVESLLPTQATRAREVLLRQLGVVRPRTWAGTLPGYWTLDPNALDAKLRELAGLAPMTEAEARQAAGDLRLPEEIDIDRLLGSPESRLSRHAVGWIRPARHGRDVAYLWLRQQGEPKAVPNIAAVAGIADHAMRETMRRDEAFVQVRPEGTWALVDWRVPGAERQYSSAVEVVTEVLRDLGPLDFDALCAETVCRYPVTTWRVKQCLSDSAVGLNADGLYDLAERGAIPVQDEEPKRPKNISVQGDVVGVILDVNHDMLRGSGLGVNRWLTWYLGLRIAPSTRYFTIDGMDGTVTVRRGTSVSQISSLRTVANTLGLVEGCKLVMLIHLDVETVNFQHACQASTCPAVGFNSSA